jgi:enoyl-CoA hydratase/carnithine racemase
MNFSDIVYDKSGRIATVTMNRPEKSNAWTPRMGAEMREAMTDADRDDQIGAIIVTGAGKNYCAGADMANLSSIATGAESAAPRPREQAKPSATGQRPDFQGQFSWVLGLRKPVICAINGACAGLGFTMSLYYDIRIASERARMGLIFVQRGLAIEHGSSWMLPRLVGVGKAVELAVTGKLIDANEALRIGLVNRVVPHEQLMPAAKELATEIATKCSPLGVAEAKRMIYEHLFTDLATGIRDDDELMGKMTRSEDFKEGIKAFLEKRAPNFVGR